MEKGDNYWTGSSPAQGKNWQTRKAQQDEYRRQLDEQILERKRLENGSGSVSVDSAPRKILEVVELFKPQQLPPPRGGSYRHQKSSIMMPPAGFSKNDENNHVSGGNRSQGVTDNFEIGGSHADKPVSGRRHVSQESVDGRSYQSQQDDENNYVSGGNNRSQGVTDFFLNGGPHAADKPLSMRRHGSQTSEDGQSQDDENNYLPAGKRSQGVTDNFIIGGPPADKQMSMRRHVSQKSEDGPSQSQMKCNYREELQKQIEAKKKLEEERRRQEKEEEDMLQKRVKEDHERMQREHEEEKSRRKNKEDEKRSKEQDILRHTEKAQRKEEERRKYFKDEQRKLRLKQTISQTDNLNKANAVAETEPPRLEDPYDSTPIPKFGLNVEDVPEPELPDLPNDTEFFDGNLGMVEPPLPYKNSVDASNDYNNNHSAVEVSKSAEACSFIVSAKPMDPYSQFSSGDNCDSAKCSKSFSVDDVKLQNNSSQENATSKSTNHEHREGLEYLTQLRLALITEKEKVDHRIREMSKKRNSFTISK